LPEELVLSLARDAIKKLLEKESPECRGTNAKGIIFVLFNQ
jgi:hypothetical protein